VKTEMASNFIARIQTNLSHSFLSDSVRNRRTVDLVRGGERVIAFRFHQSTQLDELVKNLPLLTQVGSSFVLTV
jgi:hypothetical protein